MFITLLAGAFVLGVVVLVHEFGHFIVAKWSGVFVKTFSVGFGKKILKRRWGETEYALSVLPFGGYVKFAGETEYYDDVQAEAEREDQPLKTDEIPDSEIPRERYFTTKPVAIRSAVLFAGPFMNYVLAVLLFIGMVWIKGTQVYPTTEIGEVAEGSAADSVGLMAGDRFESIDGVAVQNWGDVLDVLYDNVGTVKHMVVERGSKTLDMQLAARKVEDGYRYGIVARVPAKVGRVKRDKPAYKAGIGEGAVITAINDTTITTWEEMQTRIQNSPDKPLYVQWTQDGVAHADTIVPHAVKAVKPGTLDEFVVIGQVGITPYFVERRESLPTSIVMGFNTANAMIARIITYLGLLFTGKMGVDTLGGPILISQMAGDQARWGFDYLLGFLAFFSINLCIFNLIPLLPFDGGHLALLGYEAVARRPVNRRFRDIFAQAGFVLIILLMAFVIMLDVNRCSGSSPGLF
ncbi:MAG: RIP metalloprotease RseP [Candidatus Latescibacterota bacterium]|jgi:regulator of sigma E protease